MTDLATDDQTVLDDLDRSLDNFEAVLTGAGAKKGPSLRENWIYLQLFATTGLRLPHTDAILRTLLNLTDTEAADFVWYKGMLEAYQGFNKTSEYFFSDVFGKVTDVGGALKNFADDASGKDSLFTLIHALVQPGDEQDLGTALELLTDLKATSATNAKLAADVKANLATYKAKMIDDKGAIKTVKNRIEDDDTVNDKKMKKLDGGVDIMGSLEQIKAYIKKRHHDYDDAIGKIETSAAYAWAGPVGFGVAAGLDIKWALEADQAMDDIDKYQGKLVTASSELVRAHKIHATNDLAEDSMDDVITHIDFAIAKTGAVQDSWESVGNGLHYISGKVAGSLKPETPEHDKLRGIRIVSTYMKLAEKRWTKVKPIIVEMTSNAYVSIEPKEIDLNELKKRIGKVLEEAKKEGKV